MSGRKKYFCAQSQARILNGFGTGRLREESQGLLISFLTFLRPLFFLARLAFFPAPAILLANLCLFRLPAKHFHDDVILVHLVTFVFLLQLHLSGAYFIVFSSLFLSRLLIHGQLTSVCGHDFLAHMIHKSPIDPVCSHLLMICIPRYIPPSFYLF